MPHLRKDPLKNAWVVMAPERAARPLPASSRPKDPDPDSPCPLCPGNEDKTPPEITSVMKPDGSGWQVRVVPNAYPALKVEERAETRAEGLFDLMAGVGAHEIVIETPIHDRDLSRTHPADAAVLLKTLRDRVADLKRDQRMAYAAVFKNRGGAAGASLYHPHFQIIALPVEPRDIRDELDAARSYFEYRGRCAYCDVLGQEVQDGRRVVLQSRNAVALCPYASRYPFECMVVPREHGARFEEASDDTLAAVAESAVAVLSRLDAALNDPPYNLAVHSLPFTSGSTNHYHWHLEILPWTESMGGLERCHSTFINPVLPEEAAAHLRRL